MFYIRTKMLAFRDSIPTDYGYKKLQSDPMGYLKFRNIKGMTE
jgi:hypothetical protein